MREIWYYILAEFRARGFGCVIRGPEFWLGVACASAVGIIALAVAAVWIRWIRRQR